MIKNTVVILNNNEKKFLKNVIELQSNLENSIKLIETKVAEKIVDQQKMSSFLADKDVIYRYLNELQIDLNNLKNNLKK